jgi:hypothetical protein
LGGRAMEIVYDEDHLKKYIKPQNPKTPCIWKYNYFPKNFKKIIKILKY